MNPALDYLHNIVFRLKIHESKGQEWEDLFVAVMEMRDSSFTKIKASPGDGGNDGYRRDGGEYYACYGPDDSSADRTKKEVCDKAERDLLKLIANWHGSVPIQKYYPVFNDRFEGITQELEQKVIALKQAHNLVDSTVFRAKHLEDAFMGLAIWQRERIIGHVPNPIELEESNVDLSSLNRVIRHVLKRKHGKMLPEHLETPELEDKIEFNTLSKYTGALIQSHVNDGFLVREYFEKNSEWSRQELRDVFASFYMEELDKVSARPDSDAQRKNDSIFWAIVAKAIPDSVSSSTDRAIQEAVLTLMAFYFEACDIFEPVPQDWRSP